MTRGSKNIIPSGYYSMGSVSSSGFVLDKESPNVRLKVDSFVMEKTPVTVEEFSRFIKDTGYKTDAEHYGWSYVFYMLVPEELRSCYLSLESSDWWLVVEKASWRMPEGPHSSVAGRGDHPVTHVSRNDALAYCRWANKRLPTEAEWAYAAGNGRSDLVYPWGNELLKGGKHRCNIWQGEFPTHNTEEDGYLGTAPVQTYEPNEFGLYQMIGNVWEWCLNPGLIDLEEFKQATVESFLHSHSSYSEQNYALKGGSFLCHHSYCSRYRIAARHQSTASTSASHVGFRCAEDL